VWGIAMWNIDFELLFLKSEHATFKWRQIK
jgi:hypothetical protein